MDISEVLNLEDGDEIDEITGEVTTVYEQNSGKGRKPPHRKWTVQNFMIEDDTDSVKVGAWNMDDLSELEGQTVTLKRDMHYKDDGEYQSVELGKNTKIIEAGASESPHRARKSNTREKRETTRGKTAGSSNRNYAIYWQTCLKVASNVFTGTSEVAAGAKGGLLEFARELFNARPGTAPQNKVRKLSEAKVNEELAAEHRSRQAETKAKGERFREED